MLHEDFYVSLFLLDFQAMNLNLNLIALYALNHLHNLFRKHIPRTDVFLLLLDQQADHYIANNNDVLFYKS